MSMAVTLAVLIASYRTGEVTAPMMLDNDQACVYQDGEKVFDSDPQELLEDALTLLGIPFEHV